MTSETNTLPIIGWREWVYLSDLKVGPIKAKVDSGARSSSIHASNIRVFKRNEEDWVQFDVVPHQKDLKQIEGVESRILDFRNVRSSNGEVTLRPVISTSVKMLGELFPVELTLADRKEMSFRMLLGREAFRGRFLVHAGRSYLGGRPKRKRKRQ